MPIFCATYDYGDDLEKLAAARPAHRAWLAEQDSLLASGPTDANGAVLIFEGATAAEVEALLDNDPLAAAGVIAVRRVVGWSVVRGRWLTMLHEAQ